MIKSEGGYMNKEKRGDQSMIYVMFKIQRR